MKFLAKTIHFWEGDLCLAHRLNFLFSTQPQISGCQKSSYRISANSFRGNYSFLKFFVQRSQYISIKFPLHKPSENRGNYSREETIQGRKLFAEIRYMSLDIVYFLTVGKGPLGIVISYVKCHASHVPII